MGGRVESRQKATLMNTPHKILLSVVTAAALSAAAGTASAQNFAGRHGAHTSRFDVEPHFVLGYGFDRGPGYTDGVGFGLRLGVPLLPHGPLAINNSLVLSFGADLTYWSGPFQRDTFWRTSEVIFPFMLQWNFYLTPWFSIFPEIGAAFGSGGCGACAFFALPGVAFGARIHLDGRAGYPALVFRVGFPSGFTAGIVL